MLFYKPKNFLIKCFNQLNNRTPASVNDYSEDISYDANGNILKYKRFANSTDANLTNAAVMDSLNYYYEPNSNRLDRISDNVATAKFSVDIDTRPSDNYNYDAIGNLIRDSAENIKSITWNVYGKIQQVLKKDNSTITYYYDASGNRLGKVVAGAASGNGETWYVHDASGNTMAVYTVNNPTVNGGALTLSEQSIYGSSRLGIYRPALNLATTYNNPKRYISGIDSGYYSNFTRGIKLFELTNHLGNVLATITDKKIGVYNGNGVFNHYDADIVTANDYYPGGMTMPGRSYTANNSSYRYGFNGHEKMDEVYGSGNDYDMGARMYDPRIVRTPSIDPMASKYPGWSPYSFTLDNPINLMDPDGQEPVKPLVGTVSTFINIFNNTPSKIGLTTGAQAGQALLRLGSTEFSWKQMRPLPTTTPYFNNREGRYIYTGKGGWIDMVHFLFYAGKAYDYKLQKESAQKAIDELKKDPQNMAKIGQGMDAFYKTAAVDPVGEAVQEGYKQEMSDRFAAKYSAYSYEDLPTDKFAAEFGANVFDPNSKLTLGEQIQNYLNNNLQATDPSKAPNYKQLPTTEPTDKPSRTNHTTKPVYTTDNP